MVINSARMIGLSGYDLAQPCIEDAQACFPQCIKSNQWGASSSELQGQPECVPEL